MKIACLQFSPRLGDVSNNLVRADAVLSRADPEDLQGLDLLVLPEMAFSGYNFKSLQHIAPYLEPTGAGLSALWARTAAIKLKCAVAVGYPEKVDPTPQWPTSPEYYNSLLVVAPSGETLATYRKSFLYYTDETWALEGSGFFSGYVDGLGHLAIGICCRAGNERRFDLVFDKAILLMPYLHNSGMDVNPYKFESPWSAFEFAHHVLLVKANLVIVSMAWLTREEHATFTRHSDEPDMDTLTYWVQRLEPVIRAETKEEIIFIFCNRCGKEDDAVYAGTSAVIGIKEGEVSAYGLLGRGVKGLMVVDTEKQPFGKLVHRPEPAESIPLDEAYYLQ